MRAVGKHQPFLSELAMPINVRRQTLSFPPIVTGVMVVAALYFGRGILVPIALAVLLAFLLEPLVTWMEKLHLGRSGPVILSVLLAVSILGVAGWVVFVQTVDLADQFPSYRATISKKIESIRGARGKGKGLAKAQATVNELGKEISSSIGTAPSDTASPTTGSRPVPAANRAHPLPVEVIPQTNPISSLWALVSPLLGPLANIGIIMVFTAFILLRREDLQRRLFTLAGLARFHVTAQAFDETTHLVGRYLLLQSIVNLVYGAVFGTALYFIQVPNALLWGVLAAVLRFIPYVGILVAGFLPIFLSFAVFDGWTRVLLTAGTFIALEVITAYVVEPLLYGSQVGISSLAILVAAVFWAALWGPAGLLLSTPLTVVIVVVGRYIPQLEFLSILFGDERVLATEVQLYQALLQMDMLGAKRVVSEYLKEKSIVELYDSVFMPVLIFIEKDRQEAELGDDRAQFLFQALKELMEDLTLDSQTAGLRILPAEQSLPPMKAGSEPAVGIACIPARDEADEIAGMMLAHLLTRAGCQARVVAPAALEEMLEEVSQQVTEMIYISSLPPLAVSHLSKLYKKIRARFPNAKIGVGLWGFPAETDAIKARLQVADADIIVTTISKGLAQVSLATETVAQ